MKMEIDLVVVGTIRESDMLVCRLDRCGVALTENLDIDNLMKIIPGFEIVEYPEDIEFLGNNKFSEHCTYVVRIY